MVNHGFCRDLLGLLMGFYGNSWGNRGESLIIYGCVVISNYYILL
jgi:hypothetical protein